MFEFFPGDYSLNLAANIALSTGAQLGDLERACGTLRAELAKRDASQDERTRLMAEGCARVGDELSRQAEVDFKAGRNLSASDKYMRANVLLQMAERAQSHLRPGWEALYSRVLDSFRNAIVSGGHNCEFIEIPYPVAGSTIPGLLTTPQRQPPSSTPCLIFLNGLDSTKEMVYGSRLPGELEARGVSTLAIDQPGTGEALRLRGLTGVVESELYATAALEFLAENGLADPNRIGIGGWSLGGYFAPRAAAYEPRFQACAAWGAVYDYGEIQRRRAANEEGSNRPVPHYWEHVRWAFGCASKEDWLEFSQGMNLAAVSERIRCPYLIVHGSNDRQIPGEFAQRQLDAARNSPDAELAWVTPEQGGIEHVGADNMRFSVSYIADWVSEVLV